MAWGAILGAIGSFASSAVGAVGAAGSAVVRAAASPAGQAILKGALDLGVGVLGSLGTRSPSGVGSAAHLGLGNPYAVNRGGAAGITYSPGINPAAPGIGRNFPTVGDFGTQAFVGGPSMALLGAPVLAAARTVGQRALQVLTGTTARSVAGGAAGAAAVGAFTGGGTMARRPLSRVITMDEMGRPISYAYEGRPVLYSRDLAVVRRVRRVQADLNRLLPRSGGRRFR